MESKGYNLFIIDTSVSAFNNFSKFSFHFGRKSFGSGFCQDSSGFFMNTGAEIFTTFVHPFFVVVTVMEFGIPDFFSAVHEGRHCSEIFAAMTNFFDDFQIGGIFVKTDTFFDAACKTGNVVYHGQCIVMRGQAVFHEADVMDEVTTVEDRKTEGLILTKSVKENITLAALTRKFMRGFIIDHKKEADVSEEYREKLRIKTPGINRQVKFLSGGNQQKVVFAKWLCSGVDIYIFDEPTRGIDVGAKSEIYQIINDLVAQGAAVIVISSELPEILGICDRVLVMRDGWITANIDRSDATQEKIMSYSI